jgi:hypothetical protein
MVAHMKLIKILTAFIALAFLQIAAAQWLNVPPPAEARNLMVFTAGVPVVGGCSASYFSDNFDRANSATVGGTWTSETDTGSLLSIDTNKMLLTHSAATNAIMNKNLGTTYTELWVQFKITFNVVTGLGAWTDLYVIDIQDSGGPSAMAYLAINNNSSGNVYQATLWYKDDAGTSQDLAFAWVPSINTEYTLKFYFKVSATTSSNDGIVKMWIDGANKIDQSALDFSYSSKDFRYVQLGNLGSNLTSTTLTVKFDDFNVRGDDCF